MKRFAVKLAIAVVFISTAVFLLFSYNTTEIQIPADEITMPEKQIEAVSHIQKVEVINGNRQVINILEVNLENEKVNILPVLSHDSIFGFEKTSAMAQRKKAFAAVNGGFFYSYGQPSGFVVIDEELLCTAPELTRRPIFGIKENRELIMEDIDIRVFVNINDVILSIDGINREPGQDEVIAFTPQYGLDTRLNGRIVFNTVVEDGMIIDSILSDQQVRIPRQGLIVALAGKKIEELSHLLSQKGKKVKVTYEVSSTSGEIAQALEGGFWVVKNGENVVKEKEPWVGLMTNREPRTAVGIKNNHIAVFITVDGRQPGHSIGVTGSELAEYLISQGIKNALMLDGGASTTMVVNDKIINKPSYRGRERMIGGAIVIKVDK